MRTERGINDLNKWSIRSDSYKGCKVKYINANNCDHDTISANQYLVQGQIYTIDFEVVDRWQTNLYLEEVEGVGFNSVMIKHQDKKRKKNTIAQIPI